MHTGRAGQAVIRGECNTIGLATKRIPSHVQHAYYRCAARSVLLPWLTNRLACE